MTDRKYKYTRQDFIEEITKVLREKIPLYLDFNNKPVAFHLLDVSELAEIIVKRQEMMEEVSKKETSELMDGLEDFIKFCESKKIKVDEMRNTFAMLRRTTDVEQKNLLLDSLEVHFEVAKAQNENRRRKSS